MSDSSQSFANTSQVLEGVPPAVIERFNVYDILEPKKVATTPSTTGSKDLIDFETPNKVNKLIEREEEGFTIIDVFENIYVSPQLVNEKPKSPTHTNIDYEDFIRKIKTVNLDKSINSETDQAQKSLLDFDFSYFEEVTPPESNISIEKDGSLDNPSAESYQEDLIDEVLLDRSLQKLKLSDDKIKDTLQGVKILTTPKISNNVCNDNIRQKDTTKEQISPQTQNQTIKNTNYVPGIRPITSPVYSNNIFPVDYNISPFKDTNCKKSYLGCIDSKIEFQNTLDRLNMLGSPKLLNDIICNNQISSNNETDIYSELNYRINHSLNLKTDPNTVAPNFEVCKDNKTNTNPNYFQHFPSASTNHNNNHTRKIKSSINNGQSKTFESDVKKLFPIVINPAIMKTMPLQTITKDPKDYAKNRITKSDAEKLKFTKGPDVYEKSVALPEILQRLSDQRKLFEIKCNTRKRLVLYSDRIGVKTSYDHVVLEPEILMEDCNRERLMALKIRQRYSSFVEGR